MPYSDLRDYLDVLAEKKLLAWVHQEVDKDWEISCINHLLLWGYPEEERIGIGYNNIKGYHGMRLVAGVVGASSAVIATALDTENDLLKIQERVTKGLMSPIEPVLTGNAPCKDVIIKGDDIDLLKFPIPVWTPGEDPGPYLTPLVFTKEPETGHRNVGIYRAQVKGRNRTGLEIGVNQHAYIHLRMWEERGKSTPAALVMGTTPALYYVGASKYEYGFDEVAAAGGMAGEPVKLVTCETIDMEVPATAEIVVEGEIEYRVREPEGPFGEYTGYMAGQGNIGPVFRVKCITHRNDPILQGVTSQMPPSESQMLKKVFNEGSYLKHIKHDLKIPGVIDYCLPEAGGSTAMHWVRIKKLYVGQVEQIAGAIMARCPGRYKWIVVCDEDINIRDPFAREWVLSWHVRASEDIRIIPNTDHLGLDPSAFPPGTEEAMKSRFEQGLRALSSKVIIDATRKWKYHPLSVPLNKYLSSAKDRWHLYGLPPLKRRHLPIEVP